MVGPSILGSCCMAIGQCPEVLLPGRVSADMHGRPQRAEYFWNVKNDMYGRWAARRIRPVVSGWSRG